MWFDRVIEILRALARLSVAALLVALSLLLLAKYASGPLVDYVLANAVGLSERKMPPTVTNYRVGAEDIDIVGGMGQGLSCSLPGFVEALGFPRDDKTASISLQMRQACVHHDLCYRHGAATYGYGQVDCDVLLQQNAFKLCTQIGSSEASVTRCESEARKIALGVTLGGSDSFRRADSAPADARPGCAYCRYLKVWNAWRSDYWTDEPAAWDSRSSTYYEFDGQPERSGEFISVRIADAPASWTTAEARPGSKVAPKAVYVFRTRPSGIQLRIFGLREDGSRLCAAYTLGGDFRFRSSLPVVARMTRPEDGVAEDWFVWMRQNETNRPETAFSGLAPGRATSSDWSWVFGSSRDITAGSLCRGDRRALSDTDAVASFVDVKARDQRGRLQFVGLNALYPYIPADEPQAAGAMTLFGLTDRLCSVDEDRSSCVVRITISPVQGRPGASALALERARVEREPFKPREANCVGAPTDEHCDAYRNFVLPPRVVRAETPAGLAWTRRGASNGDGYPQSAILRWTPARNPDGTAPLYPQIPIERLKEGYEPTAWTAADARGRQGMVSIVASPACGGLKVMRFALEPRPGEAAPSLRSTRCLPDLDASWLSRPWRLVDGRKALMFRMTFVERVGCETNPSPLCVARPWPGSALEVAEFDIDLHADAATEPDRADRTKTIAVLRSPPLFAQHFCLVDANNPRKHFATSTECAAGEQTRTGAESGVEAERSATELDFEARLRDISGLINRAPLIVGDMDGDGSPEIGLLSLAFDEVLIFKERSKGSASWIRLDPPS